MYGRKPQPLMAPLQSYDNSPYHDYGDYDSQPPYQYDYGGGYGGPSPPATGFRKGFGSRSAFGGGRSRGGAGGPVGAKVINSHTSDMDPVSMASRIFVGNVNTALVGREHLEKVFGRFGVIRGISIHKGYAFVQYSNENEARQAVSFTDGTSFGGKPLDVNMVSEPKQSRGALPAGQNIGRGAKRQRTDFAYSYGSAAGTPVLKQVPITYEDKMDTSRPEPDVELQPADVQPEESPIDDVFFCGNCRAAFNVLKDYVEHRKIPCEKKEINVQPSKQADEPDTLYCFSCKADFSNSWLLLKHLKENHNMTMWEDTEAEKPAA